MEIDEAEVFESQEEECLCVSNIFSREGIFGFSVILSLCNFSNICTRDNTSKAAYL